MVVSVAFRQSIGGMLNDERRKATADKALADTKVENY